MKQPVFYITYIGSDEMIVTTPEREARAIEIYFEGPNAGRDISKYFRDEHYESETMDCSALDFCIVWG